MTAGSALPRVTLWAFLMALINTFCTDLEGNIPRLSLLIRQDQLGVGGGENQQCWSLKTVSAGARLCLAAWFCLWAPGEILALPWFTKPQSEWCGSLSCVRDTQWYDVTEFSINKALDSWHLVIESKWLLFYHSGSHAIHRSSLPLRGEIASDKR